MQADVTTMAEMMKTDEEYVIPYFQRRYAWNEENQWSPLWDDIVNVADAIGNADDPNDVPPHFMGPIVIQERSHHPDGRPPGYIVVDGQQRITTLLIILKAIGDAACECGQPELAEEFLGRIWNNIGYGQKTPKVRHTRKQDSLNLREVLQGINSTDIADNRMYQCYDHFNTAAVRYIRNGNDIAEQCVNLLTTLDKKMQTALLKLDANEQPNLVFETLNGRGEPLHPFELVKNTIMYEGGVTEDDQVADALWSPALEEPWWQDGKLNDFLADWLTAQKRRRIRSQRVAPEFRAHTQEVKSNGRDVRHITDRMNRAAEMYRAVQHNDFPATMPASERLMAMRLPSTMPVILWLWDDDNSVSRIERQTCIRLIENYAIRRVIANLSIGDIMTNIMTNMLLPRLKEAADAGESPAKAIRRTLQQLTIEAARWPRDREIMDRLSAQPHEMNATRRDVILKALESQLRRDAELEPLERSVTTTQLMPSGEAGETNYPMTGNRTEARHQRRQQHLRYIGNFTLVTRSTNRNNNAPWEEKIASLSDSSEVMLTKQLLEHHQDQWTDQDITDRSVWMAEIAVRTWPYPESE